VPKPISERTKVLNDKNEILIEREAYRNFQRLSDQSLILSLHEYNMSRSYYDMLSITAILAVFSIFSIAEYSTLLGGLTAILTVVYLYKRYRISNSFADYAERSLRTDEYLGDFFDVDSENPKSDERNFHKKYIGLNIIDETESPEEYIKAILYEYNIFDSEDLKQKELANYNIRVVEEI
jgi:hypothetical protein